MMDFITVAGQPLQVQYTVVHMVADSLRLKRQQPWIFKQNSPLAPATGDQVHTG
jgi:hypothetical protein